MPQASSAKPFPPSSSTTPDESSDASSPVIDKDLEKGEPGAKESNEVDQGGLDRRRTKEEDNVVGWDGPEDPENPQNWSHSKKYTVTVLYATLTFTLTFASSVFSTATTVTAELYGVSEEVMILGTSLFVLVSISYGPPLHLSSLNLHRVSQSVLSSGVH